MKKTKIDDLLLQEIFSLKEKIKIMVYHLKQYDQSFDVNDYMHALNSVEFEQWMEEITSNEKDKTNVAKPGGDSRSEYTLLK